MLVCTTRNHQMIFFLTQSFLCTVWTSQNEMGYKETYTSFINPVKFPYIKIESFGEMISSGNRKSENCFREMICLRNGIR
ncbi:unnamed protein product [Rhizophagus irregularis]|uniref:Secreted protein n=2 Tax=Rhizophagus irregularis TaxID=588596 RepID=A0A2P4QIW2_RHIID|nr:hypothetical protein GLOIN_2v1545459 [Rhizophagus irregularis DAOM 181602=DAOM 197198]POG77556.1 hypothetical protein GLOIN_2v1545459 [Rhizophagus irregularis DAOM 181602=DAOM 197198]CAB4460601.1 unnamed protein product [Rhizophagus irregularis]|eukprot:XP_025184422.1 hypothetical protein GLOIN_2v1545459 [Rhizophagus irregularis DAOM 181602=DAOM 197198]